MIHVEPLFDGLFERAVEKRVLVDRVHVHVIISDPALNGSPSSPTIFQESPSSALSNRTVDKALPHENMRLIAILNLGYSSSLCSPAMDICFKLKYNDVRKKLMTQFT
jgi:hypothetical protein